MRDRRILKPYVVNLFCNMNVCKFLSYCWYCWRIPSSCAPKFFLPGRAYLVYERESLFKLHIQAPSSNSSDTLLEDTLFECDDGRAPSEAGSSGQAGALHRNGRSQSKRLSAPSPRQPPSCSFKLSLYTCDHLHFYFTFPHLEFHFLRSHFDFLMWIKVLVLIYLPTAFIRLRGWN